MLRLCLLCAAGLGAWSATVCSQAAVPGPLSGTLRDHVRNERFDAVTSVRGLPLGVRETLQDLFGTQTLDIAEPNADFQGSDAMATAKRPLRRLIVAGCSIDHCFVHYERRGSSSTWPVVLFHWTPDATLVEWSSLERSGLPTIADLRAAALTAGAKGQVTEW